MLAGHGDSGVLAADLPVSISNQTAYLLNIKVPATNSNQNLLP